MKKDKITILILALEIAVIVFLHSFKGNEVREDSQLEIANTASYFDMEIPTNPGFGTTLLK